MKRTNTFFGSMLAGLLAANVAAAADFDDFGTNGQVYEFDLPTIVGGWSVAFDGFPNTGASAKAGIYELRGRLLAVNGNKVYLQKNYGSSQWVEVANTGSVTMDPSFVRISKSGTEIAIGLGYNQKLLFFNASLLNPSSPNLTTHANVLQVTADYYDGAWRDDNTFFINGGAKIGSTYTSGVIGYTLTTGAGAPTVSSGPYQVINSLTGASAGLSFDSAHNFVTGIGYLPSPVNRTGEIRIWSASTINAIISGGSSVAYATGLILANNILSADSLGFDADDNLHVGGGDAFGVGGASENGYMALVRQSACASALGGGGAVNEAGSDYRELAPDPCEDDSSTSPIAYVPWSGAVTVAWNSSGNGGVCYAAGSAQDYWSTGVTPKITQYFAGSAPDGDGDGIPDGADNAYKSFNALQWDTDGDGWGNRADCDFNNDGFVNATDQAFLNGAKVTYDAEADLDEDGAVNNADQLLFNARLGTSAPWY